jgi:hypothetical protein
MPPGRLCRRTGNYVSKGAWTHMNGPGTHVREKMREEIFTMTSARSNALTEAGKSVMQWNL